MTTAAPHEAESAWALAYECRAVAEFCVRKAMTLIEAGGDDGTALVLLAVALRYLAARPEIPPVVGAGPSDLLADLNRCAAAMAARVA